MRYSLMGFYQPELIKTDLDLIDLVILKYIADASIRNSMTRINIESNQYVWLSHSKFHEDLPFLKMAESTLKNRLTKLKKDGLIDSVTKRFVNGSNTYYTVTEKYENLLYGAESTENNARTVESTSARTVESTSDSKLIDSKLNKDIISKDIISADKSANENTLENLENNPSTDTYSNTTVNKRNIKTLVNIKDETSVSVSQPKKKRRSRYEQFMDVVDEFTDNEQLNTLLKEYAVVRMEKSKEDGDADTFYASKFKSIVKKLSDLSDNIDMQCKIVQQSIDKRYRILCPLNNSNSNSIQSMKNRGIQMTEPDAKSFKDGKEAQEYTENLIRENEKRGRRAVF